MAWRPLPAVWPLAPRPPYTLWQLPSQVLYQSRPWLQKGRSRHGASQWAPWRSSRLGRPSLHPLTHARRHPHLFRSRREEDKGYACWGQRKQRSCSSASARGHRTEGRPDDPWTLVEKYGQCSQHACLNTDAQSHRTKDPERCLQEAKGGRSGCTWRHASSSAGTYPPLPPWWMDCWEWRRWQPWRVFPVAWTPSGINTTQRCVDTSRVGLWSFLCAPPTAAYEDSGCRRTRSVCSGHSGRMAQG